MFELIDDVLRRLQHWVEALKSPHFEDILDRGILREDVYKQEVEPLLGSVDEIKKQLLRLTEDVEKEGILNAKEAQKAQGDDALKPAAELLVQIQSSMSELKSTLSNISGKGLVRSDLEKADSIARGFKATRQEITELREAFKEAFEPVELFNEEDIRSAADMAKEIAARREEVVEIRKEARRLSGARDVSLASEDGR